MASTTKERLIAAFQDVYADGVIPRSDLARVLQVCMGSQITGEEVSALVDSFGESDQTNVDVSVFCDALFSDKATCGKVASLGQPTKILTELSAGAGSMLIPEPHPEPHGKPRPLRLFHFDLSQLGVTEMAQPVALAFHEGEDCEQVVREQVTAPMTTAGVQDLVQQAFSKRAAEELAGALEYRQSADCVIFDVDTVMVSDQALRVQPMRKAMAKWAEGGALLCASSDCDLVKPRIVGPYQTNTEHPLLSAVHISFRDHRPLVLSPDILWLTVSQGVALHVRNNAEGLRERLGVPQGKTLIHLACPAFDHGSPAAWQSHVEDFAQTAGWQGPRLEELRSILTCSFSTTGPEERCASQVVFLDSVQEYFEYEAGEICGIPSVTLEGSVSDWAELEKRVAGLEALDIDLDFWTPHLKAIFAQFTHAARGEPDRAFWKRIYKLREAYGQEGFTGWVGSLFPYLRSGCWESNEFRRRNHCLKCNIALLGFGDQQKCIDFFDLEDDEHEMGEYQDVESGGVVRGRVPKVLGENVPAGLSFVNFLLSPSGEQPKACRFIAGFFGMEQGRGPHKMALRPRIAWAVAEAPAADQELIKLAVNSCHRVVWNVSRAVDISWPTMVRRFYSQLESCAVHCGEAGDGPGILELVWPTAVRTFSCSSNRLEEWLRVGRLPNGGAVVIPTRGPSRICYTERVWEPEEEEDTCGSTTGKEEGAEEGVEEEEEEEQRCEDGDGECEEYWGCGDEELETESCRECSRMRAGFALCQTRASGESKEFYCQGCWPAARCRAEKERDKTKAMAKAFEGVAMPVGVAPNIEGFLQRLNASAQGSLPFFLQPGWEPEPPPQTREAADDDGDGDDDDEGWCSYGGDAEPLVDCSQAPCEACGGEELTGFVMSDECFYCRECVEKRTVSIRERRLQDMRELAEQRGGACLSEAYAPRLRWRCQAGHEFTARPHSVSTESWSGAAGWCPRCARRREYAEFKISEALLRLLNGPLAAKAGFSPGDEIHWNDKPLVKWRDGKVLGAAEDPASLRIEFFPTHSKRSKVVEVPLTEVKHGSASAKEKHTRSAKVLAWKVMAFTSEMFDRVEGGDDFSDEEVAVDGGRSGDWVGRDGEEEEEDSEEE